MIVRRDKTYETNSILQNVDWYDEGNYIIDETKKENKILIEKIKQHAPYMELVIKDGEITNIIPIEKPMSEPEIVEETVDEEKVAMAEAIVMLESRVMELENKNIGVI